MVFLMQFYRTEKTAGTLKKSGRGLVDESISKTSTQKSLMKNKNRIFIWTLFDFANTSFSIVVVTFLYAVYFKKVVAQN